MLCGAYIFIIAGIVMLADSLLTDRIFFVEGSLTVLVAMVAFFFLPDTPGAARFFTKEEQEFAVQRLRVDLYGAVALDTVEEEEHFNWKEASIAVVLFVHASGINDLLTRHQGPLCAAQHQHHCDEF